MRKSIVLKRLAEATNERGQVNLDILGQDVATQFANAYVSGERGMLPLYSKEAVAKYYDTSENVVSECIDRAIVRGYLKFGTVVKIIRNSADNERRHAQHKGLTKSEKRYAKLIQDRFKQFKETFEQEENRAKYDAAYKMYLGQSTMQKVMGAYGLSEQEMLYLLVRKACIDMSETEYGIFSRKFFQDFLGKNMYHTYVDYIVKFRKEMCKTIEQMQKFRVKDKEAEEYKTAREELVKYFESH